MAIIIEKPSSCTIIVKGEYSPDEIQRKMNEMVKKYAKQVRVPGFRPGKAPKSMIVSRYSDAFLDEIRQDFLSETVQKSIEESPELEKALYTDEPKMDKIEIGKPFTIEIYAEVKPQFELVKYDGFEIERSEIPVQDEEIDKAIEDILIRNTSLDEISRAAGENDYVEIKFFEGDNEPVPMMIPLDDPEFLQFFTGLLGKSIGDTIEIEAAFPDNFPDRRLQKKNGKFRLEITKVLEQVKPELNDEFFKKMGKPDGFKADDFRSEVAEYIRQQKVNDADQEIKQKIIDELVKENPVDVPPKYLDARVKQYISQRWDVSKIKPEELDKLGSEIKPTIEKQIGYEFIGDKIAEIEKIEVDDNEVLDIAKNLIASMGYSPDIAEQIYKPQSDEFERLRKQAKRDKALNIVISHSTIKVKPLDEISATTDNSPNIESSENPKDNENAR